MKASDEEIDRVIREELIPVLDKLIAQHGPKEAQRIVRASCVAMGWDPNVAMRLVLPEDVS